MIGGPGVLVEFQSRDEWLPVWAAIVVLPTGSEPEVVRWKGPVGRRAQPLLQPLLRQFSTPIISLKST